MARAVGWVKWMAVPSSTLSCGTSLSIRAAVVIDVERHPVRNPSTQLARNSTPYSSSLNDPGREVLPSTNLKGALETIPRNN